MRNLLCKSAQLAAYYIFLMCVLPITASFAEPSKQETLDYIKSNNRTFCKENNMCRDDNFGTRKITLTNCNIEFQDGFTTYSVNLKDIDPNEISGNEEANWVYITCREKFECINYKNSRDTGKSYYYSYKTDKTNKIAKAFAHLVKLCGGKAELF